MTEFVSGSGSARTPGASGWDGMGWAPSARGGGRGLTAAPRRGQSWGCPWAHGQSWGCS